MEYFVSQNARYPDTLHPACVIVGRHVRLMRNGRGWSQELLGTKADQRQGTTSAIECGEHCPHVQGVFRLAEAFGVEPEGLRGCPPRRMAGWGEEPR